MNSMGAKVMFVEVSNYNQKFLDDQYRDTVLSLPDYIGMSDVEAVRVLHIFGDQVLMCLLTLIYFLHSSQTIEDE